MDGWIWWFGRWFSEFQGARILRFQPLIFRIVHFNNIHQPVSNLENHCFFGHVHWWDLSILNLKYSQCESSENSYPKVCNSYQSRWLDINSLRITDVFLQEICIHGGLPAGSIGWLGPWDCPGLPVGTQNLGKFHDQISVEVDLNLAFWTSVVVLRLYSATSRHRAAFQRWTYGHVWEIGIIPQALPSQGHQMDLSLLLAIFQLCLLFLITCRIWDTPKSPSLLNSYRISICKNLVHCWCDKNTKLANEWISNCQDSLHFPTQIHRIVDIWNWGPRPTK